MATKEMRKRTLKNKQVDEQGSYSDEEMLTTDTLEQEENEDLTVEEYFRQLNEQFIQRLLQTAFEGIDEYKKKAEKTRQKILHPELAEDMSDDD